MKRLMKRRPKGPRSSSPRRPKLRMRAGMCLHFSYPDSIRTRARCFLRCISSQVCFESLTRTEADGPTASVTLTPQLIEFEVHSKSQWLGGSWATTFLTEKAGYVQSLPVQWRPPPPPRPGQASSAPPQRAGRCHRSCAHAAARSSLCTSPPRPPVFLHGEATKEGRAR
jgi:hypothetical protein